MLQSEIRSVRVVTNESCRMHMNKHNRPFKCEIASCSHSNGFSAKGDLERHKRAKHKELFLDELAAESSNLFFYCPEPSCHRSSSSSDRKPFIRTDNLQEHIKRRHKDLQPKHTASIIGRSIPVAVIQPFLSPALSMPEDSAGQTYAAKPRTRKRRRLERETPVSQNADGVNQELDRLREETRELKKRVKDLEHDLDLSKKSEETLYNVISRLSGS